MIVFTGSDLTCRRGERLVFADLAFDASRGDALMLRGRNGAGKSSLLRLMAGLSEPLAGTICWENDNIRQDMPAHRARMQYLGHQDAVKPVLTVRDNLRLWASLREVDNIDAVIDQALDALGILHLANSSGRFLSSGQKRRTALARILIGESDLWLLDEPTVGLDRESCADLARLIDDFRANGGIVVYSTHVDLDIASPRILNLDEFAIPMFDWLASDSDENDEFAENDPDQAHDNGAKDGTHENVKPGPARSAKAHSPSTDFEGIA
ncbi:heme ABC exporter ATP-binding protein CcmA [Thalassospira marina]|uniref:Heme ABC exporter ATP-binding protein CcmA n=1 Tax=Thalassospira marina TaxID=2048283 RepID=A0ABM6QF09_9PROT|nr:heme ABC exporter ATP-binding protein CcmA [Thalassospira marina]AUG55165.1 heme ABC exporter ATP-binding protein CcmA [Thalassospira marina]